jgi:hypothetical protein
MTKIILMINCNWQTFRPAVVGEKHQQWHPLHGKYSAPLLLVKKTNNGTQNTNNGTQNTNNGTQRHPKHQVVLEKHQQLF